MDNSSVIANDQYEFNYHLLYGEGVIEKIDKEFITMRFVKDNQMRKFSREDYKSVFMTKEKYDKSYGSLVILGNMSIGETIGKVEELANTLQVCFDSCAKKILLPMSSAIDISNVPSDLFSKFNISFYINLEDAVYIALGIE